MSVLELNFVFDQGRTRMHVARQEPPWRAIRAFRNSQQQALVHLHNVSGGILSGDTLALCVEAGAATRVQITTVGATRIYRRRSGGASAYTSTSIRVGDGALLEYLPDAVIPFSGSRFRQSTSVSLGADSGFIGWETIAAGRIASGEEFGFDSFDSECSVRCDDRPLALERFSLSPQTQDPRSPARWAGFRYLATMYICHTGVPQQQWIALEARLNDFAFDMTSRAARWGVSTLAGPGLVVRGLALEAHQTASGLSMFWDLAKQELWRERAVPPRKIN